MAANSPKRLALDSNFVFDLAAKKDFVLTCREVLQERGWTLCLAPTALDELQLIEERGEPEERRLAGLALDNLEVWGIQTFSLSDVNSAIAGSFSDRLIHAGLLPAAEWNDGVILGEAAVEGIPLLVTSDRHLLHIEHDALAKVFAEADLEPAYPLRPQTLLKTFT